MWLRCTRVWERPCVKYMKLQVILCCVATASLTDTTRYTASPHHEMSLMQTPWLTYKTRLTTFPQAAEAMASGEDLAVPGQASRWEQGEFEGSLFAYGPAAAPGGGSAAAHAPSAAHGTVRLANGCRGLLADDCDQVNGWGIAAFAGATIDRGQGLR